MFYVYPTRLEHTYVLNYQKALLLAQGSFGYLGKFPFLLQL